MPGCKQANFTHFTTTVHNFTHFTTTVHNFAHFTTTVHNFTHFTTTVHAKLVARLAATSSA